MPEPYFCPHCKTNRTRFNIIEQLARPIKLDPSSGEIVEVYHGQITDPFHIPFRGSSYKVQCATCGMIEEEELFIKAARNYPRGQI